MNEPHDITVAERAAAHSLEAALRPRVVAAWHASPEAGPRYAVVAGYTDHAAETLRAPIPAAPGRVGVGVYPRLVVLTALTRLGEDELANDLRYCPAEAFPVLLCAGTHLVLVCMHPAPEGVAPIAAGGDA